MQLSQRFADTGPIQVLCPQTSYWQRGLSARPPARPSQKHGACSLLFTRARRRAHACWSEKVLQKRHPESGNLSGSYRHGLSAPPRGRRSSLSPAHFSDKGTADSSSNLLQVPAGHGAKQKPPPSSKTWLRDLTTRSPFSSITLTHANKTSSSHYPIENPNSWTSLMPKSCDTAEHLPVPPASPFTC